MKNKTTIDKADELLTIITLFGPLSILINIYGMNKDIKGELNGAAGMIGILKKYFVQEEEYEKAQECVQIENEIKEVFDEFEPHMIDYEVNEEIINELYTYIESI